MRKAHNFRRQLRAVSFFLFLTFIAFILLGLFAFFTSSPLYTLLPNTRLSYVTFRCSLFSTHLQCSGLSTLLFCLPRKVTKRVPSRTTFLRISLTCRFKRAAARVRVGMLLHLTWYAFQVERWSRSTLTTWLYRGLCRVRSFAYFT